jgi:hypothetical protein
MAEAREDKLRMSLDKGNEPLPVRSELEIPILFLKIDNLAPLRAEFAIGPAFLVRKKLLLPYGIIAPIARLVELALVVEPLEDALDALAVARIGGGRPAVVIDAQLGPERGEFFRDLRGVLGGSMPAFCAACCTFCPCWSTPVRK